LFKRIPVGLPAGIFFVLACPKSLATLHSFWVALLLQGLAGAFQVNRSGEISLLNNMFD
jgi:hypothetical protein